MLFSKTDDEEVYLYQRKLMRKMQWYMLKCQPYPICIGLFVYCLTRRLKKYGSLDIFYFAIPYLALQNGAFNLGSKELIETGYPAHPWIVEKRTNLISETCYIYPAILKNEIEYLHRKILQNNPEAEHKIEKEF